MTNEELKQKLAEYRALEDVTEFNEMLFQLFLMGLENDDIIYMLRNDRDLLEKFGVDSSYIKMLISKISSDNAIKMLEDKELMEQLGLEASDFILCIKDYKTKMLFNDILGISKSNMIIDLASGSPEEFIDFINNQKEFLKKNGIKIFKVVRMMTHEKKLEIVSKIHEMNIPESEKRRIFAGLDNETKKAINPKNIEEKYRKLLEMKLEQTKDSIGDVKIIPKLEGDVSQYADLDELLIVEPLEIVKSEEDRQKLFELCQVCPNIEIKDDLFIGYSTTEEYIEGERWIESVLEGIQPEWTDVQKLAYIDTMIGKRVSYTPNFGTEVEKGKDQRALWKIIARGEGVCNGISQLEIYLLSRVGIEAELISSEEHAFVKVKNIKIPTENGIIEGDTLVDPTWNLMFSRYGAKPPHFCRSYEELRKVDIGSDGEDYECHKNDELAQAVTIDMDEQSLRKVYASIGIAGKDGQFPIAQLTEQIKRIDETPSDMHQKIKNKFALLKRWCPEFATCQNETNTFIQGILFEPNEHFNFKRCIASRVYDREDPQKKAVLYICMELQDGQRLFFYADRKAGEFVELTEAEFEQKFECYQNDMAKNGNKRLWETDDKTKESEVTESIAIEEEGAK